MQTLFHNNQTGVPNFQGQSNNEFHKIITLHPIKQPSVMRKIHLNSMTLKLNNLREQKILLLQELEDYFASKPKKDGPKNRLLRRSANLTNDLQHWDYLSMNKIQFCANQANCPRHTMNTAMAETINQIIIKVKYFF